MASITIDDVAEMAGVSIKTVSRVLNREPHVRPATREKVLAAVETLNYRPNVSARALAGSRSYLVGLFVDNPSPGYVAQVERGAMNACRDAGYFLVVEELRETGQALRNRIAALHSAARMDGVILTPPLCDRPDVLEALTAEGLPYVRIAPTLDLERGAYVYMDDRQAAYEMTQYLQGLGHRDIAFIAGPADHRAAAHRREGFEQAMRDAKLPIGKGRLQQGEFSFRSGWECGERLLDGGARDGGARDGGAKDGGGRPTAIFAGNDDMALGVMAVANRLHLDLPGELTLAGFDDSPSAQVVWPQLTTVRQPVAEMAALATTLLTGTAGEDDGPRGRRMDFELVVRQSSAPPAKR